MTFAKPQPTQCEHFLAEDEIIVSKTDTKGRITYVNSTFMTISGYTEAELLGKPHNVIRHPEMPRCIFQLLWEQISSGREIFAYVKNMCKNGDFYWVYAHVTPTFNLRGEITGYHSNRRMPDRTAVAKADALYKILLAEESRFQVPRDAMPASRQVLGNILNDAKLPYDEWVFSI